MRRFGAVVLLLACLGCDDRRPTPVAPGGKIQPRAFPDPPPSENAPSVVTEKFAPAADAIFDRPNNFRTAFVVRVVDADTVDLDILLDDLGESRLQRRARLYGLNSHESRTPDGKAATAHLIDILPKPLPQPPDSAKEVQPTIVVELRGREKYGRLLLILWDQKVTGEWVNLNQKMIDDGFAKSWDGQGAKP